MSFGVLLGTGGSDTNQRTHTNRNPRDLRYVLEGTTGSNRKRTLPKNRTLIPMSRNRARMDAARERESPHQLSFMRRKRCVETEYVDGAPGQH